jgi:biofilm PGA synthesis protein PgaD
MWLVYSYLWAPLISLVAWLLGFEFAYDVMVRAGGFETLKEVIWFYLIVVAIIFVVVAGWSTINRRRFARHDRRQTIDSVPDTEIAAYFGIRGEQLTLLRSPSKQVFSIWTRNQRGRLGQRELSLIMRPTMITTKIRP